MTSNITPFNYQGLSAETEAFVRETTIEIRKLAQRSAQDIRDIGLKLIQVKTRLGHGRFGRWLQDEFGWTERTAQNFMRVADRFKSEMFADLNVAPTALYMLAAPSTPKTAVDEVKKRSKNGRVTTSEVEGIVKAHKRVVTPPAPPISVADPSLSWEEQYGEQVRTHLGEVVFLIPGERATMWVAFGVTAEQVAHQTGTETYPLAGGLPGLGAIPMVCVTITDPQTGKEDAAKVADLEELLGRKTITYVESDMHLLALLRDTTKFTIEPSKILQARRDKEAAVQSARQPFAAPTPGLPVRQTVQHPPAGWQSLNPPPVVPTPAPATQTSFAPETGPDDVIEGDALVIETPAAPAVPVLPQMFADSMALIAFVAQCIDAAETAITHFGQQSTLSEADRIDLDVIEKNFWGAGALGDKARKMLTIPGKLQEARDIFALAQDVAQVEKAIGIAEQLKVGHETKDRTVKEFIVEAQAKVLALKAA